MIFHICYWCLYDLLMSVGKVGIVCELPDIYFCVYELGYRAA